MQLTTTKLASKLGHQRLNPWYITYIYIWILIISPLYPNDMLWWMMSLFLNGWLPHVLIGIDTTQHNSPMISPFYPRLCWLLKTVLLAQKGIASLMMSWSFSGSWYPTTRTWGAWAKQEDCDDVNGPTKSWDWCVCIYIYIGTIWSCILTCPL